MEEKIEKRNNTTTLLFLIAIIIIIITGSFLYLNNNKTIESCYPNNTGNLTMEISYITITTKYINNESEVIVDVHENSFNDVVGKVKVGLDSSQGADRSNEYKNIKEKVVDVLVDFNRTGSIKR